MAVRGRDEHVFARERPSREGTYSLHTAAPQEHRDVRFRPLPTPTGADPFHLNLRDIVQGGTYDAIVGAKRLAFHLNGDMGGINYVMSQELVARGMESDFDTSQSVSETPAFL